MKETREGTGMKKAKGRRASMSTDYRLLVPSRSLISLVVDRILPILTEQLAIKRQSRVAGGGP